MLQRTSVAMLDWVAAHLAVRRSALHRDQRALVARPRYHDRTRAGSKLVCSPTGPLGRNGRASRLGPLSDARVHSGSARLGRSSGVTMLRPRHPSKSTA